MDFSRPRRRIRQLTLTPLIDVVFLLLIFFMISTSFIKTESMELSLPSRHGETAEKSEYLRIYAASDGSLRFNDVPVDEQLLKEKLRPLFAEKSDRRVVLLSGKTIPVQRLVSVMDIVYLSGGRNLSVVEWHE